MFRKKICLKTLQNNPLADTLCQPFMFYKLKTLLVHNVRQQIWQWNFSRVANIKMILHYRIQIHKFFIDAFALKESVASILKDFYWMKFLNVSHATIKTLNAQCYQTAP